MRERACSARAIALPIPPDAPVTSAVLPSRRNMDFFDDSLFPEAGAAVVHAIETVLTQGPRTPDIGGTASTQEMGKAIAEAV